jgi:hypothetical protein
MSPHRTACNPMTDLGAAIHDRMPEAPPVIDPPTVPWES